jgi:hypothetical protein
MRGGVATGRAEWRLFGARTVTAGCRPRFTRYGLRLLIAHRGCAWELRVAFQSGRGALFCCCGKSAQLCDGERKSYLVVRKVIEVAARSGLWGRQERACDTRGFGQRRGQRVNDSNRQQAALLLQSNRLINLTVTPLYRPITIAITTPH